MLNGAGETTETVLECIVNDYLTFIVLLFGLFCVSGNITLEGNLAGSPAVNALFLAFGTLLSSCIGTTGASMLLVRPMIKMNSWRKNKAQIMIFFIFMISNMGGCLTPIGDPPLLMGFMRGVPFFWSLHLFPILIFNMILLLIIFYFIDKKQYRKDIANGLRPDISKPGVDIKVEGLHNVIFLVAIVVAVILSGTLPSLPMFQDAAGNVLGITIYKSVKLTFPAIIEVAIILLCRRIISFVSIKTLLLLFYKAAFMCFSEISYLIQKRSDPEPLPAFFLYSQYSALNDLRRLCQFTHFKTQARLFRKHDISP